MTLTRRTLLSLAAAGIWTPALPSLVRANDRIITAHGLSVFGDLKYPADFPHLDYVNPSAPKGGEYSSWAPGTYDSLTPFIRKGTSARFSTILYDRLMVGTGDEANAAYGLVAHSVEYPENRQWVIFHLRPEARFSDGSPVTAEDVVFSFEILREKGRPIYRIVYADFETVEALDAHRVKFTFREGALTRDLPLDAAGLPILSKAYYADKDFAESSLEPPLGSGRYLVEEVDPGRSIVYRRREDYWGEDLPINIGQSNFDRIRIEYYGDYQSAFEGFKGGSYMFREEFSSKIWSTAYDFPAIEKGWVKRDVLPDGRPAGTQGFWINMRREKFADVRVRKAISRVFNFEFINEKIMYNHYQRTISFWQNADTLMAAGMPEGAELALLERLRGEIPEEVFTETAFVPPEGALRATDRLALREAGALFDAAGWTIQNGQRRNAAGEPFVLELLNDSPTFEPHLTIFVDALKRIGIDASIQQVDPAQSQEREKTYDYDLMIQRFGMSLTPGTELRRYFGSRAADLEDGINMSGVKSPAVDALIETIIGAKSQEEVEIAVRALDRVLRAMHIWVPHWYKGTHTIAYFDLYEHPEVIPPYSMGEVSVWWYNEEKAAALREAGAIR
ncbi:MAG: extracellular solute-binding protein [Pseudomonadota bacterium]